MVGALLALLLAACAAPGGPPAPATQLATDPAVELLRERAQEAYILRDLPLAAELYQQLMHATEDSAAARMAAEISAAVDDWDSVDEAVARWLQLDPEAVPAYQLGVIAELRRGRAETAVARFRSGVMPRVGAEAVWPTAIALFAAAGDARVAERALKELLRIQAAPPGFALLQRSRLAWQLGQQAAALELAQEAFDQSADPEGALWLAAVAEELGEHERALAALAELRRIGRADRQAVLAEAELLRALDRPDEALALIQTLPEDVDVLYTIGGLLQDRGRLADAGAAWQRLAALPQVPDPNRHAWLTAVLAEALGMDREAAEWYRRVDGPQAEKARLRRAIVLGRLGREQEARALLSELRQAGSAELIEQSWLVEGQLLSDLGAAGNRDPERDAQALALYSQALTELPESNDLLYARAMLAVRMEQLELAEQDLRAIIQREPDHAIALNALGYTLSDRTDRHGEALRLIERALALAPDNPAIQDSMGWVLFKLGRAEAALPYLEAAAAAEPHPEIVAHLVETLWALDRRDEARRLVERHRNDEFRSDAVFVDTLKRLGLE